MKGASDQQSGFHGNPPYWVMLSLWVKRSWRRNSFRLCLRSEKTPCMDTTSVRLCPSISV